MIQFYSWSYFNTEELYWADDSVIVRTFCRHCYNENLFLHILMNQTVVNFFSNLFFLQSDECAVSKIRVELSHPLHRHSFELTLSTLLAA